MLAGGGSIGSAGQLAGSCQSVLAYSVPDSRFGTGAASACGPCGSVKGARPLGTGLSGGCHNLCRWQRRARKLTSGLFSSRPPQGRGGLRPAYRYSSVTLTFTTSQTAPQIMRAVTTINAFSKSSSHHPRSRGNDPASTNRSTLRGRSAKVTAAMGQGSVLRSKDGTKRYPNP